MLYNANSMLCNVIERKYNETAHKVRELQTIQFEKDERCVSGLILCLSYFFNKFNRMLFPPVSINPLIHIHVFIRLYVSLFTYT